MFCSLVSVIIPIYNVEKYISRCVDSILKQTYFNLEIIIVDDGSSDNSFYVCKEFALKDKRIKLIQLKQNFGVSTARNVGILNSSGEYVMFVDGDDFLDLRAIELLIYDFKNPDVVMSSFQLCVFEDSKKTSFFSNSEDVLTTRTSTEELKELLYWRTNSSSCCKLYKVNELKKVRFMDGRHINEDRFFVFEYLLNSQGYVYNHSVAMYGCVERYQSACRSSFSSKYDDMLFFADLMCDKTKKTNDSLLIVSAKYNCVKTYLMYIKYALRSNGWKHNIAICKSVVKRVNVFLEENKIKIGKHRLELVVLNISIKLYRFLLSCFDKITKKKTY